MLENFDTLLMTS